MGITMLWIIVMVCVIFTIMSVGTIIVYVVVNKKWGYTKKREKELEELTNTDTTNGGEYEESWFFDKRR